MWRSVVRCPASRLMPERFLPRVSPRTTTEAQHPRPQGGAKEHGHYSPLCLVGDHAEAVFRGLDVPCMVSEDKWRQRRPGKALQRFVFEHFARLVFKKRMH